MPRAQASDGAELHWEERGTGASERVGPYDLETATKDLEAVADAVGGAPMIVVGIMDGVNKAVRVAARRPDLISHVLASGGAPLGRRARFLAGHGCSTGTAQAWEMSLAHRATLLNCCGTALRRWGRNCP